MRCKSLWIQLRSAVDSAGNSGSRMIRAVISCWLSLERQTQIGP